MRFHENYGISIINKKSLVKFFVLIICVLSFEKMDAQTVTLLSPTGAGGFESGTTFSANGWTEIQPAGDNRKWQVGTAAGSQGGTRAAYVGSSSNNNGINAAKVDHFYRDLVVPANAVNVQLNFYIKQTTTDDTYDYLYVFTTSTSNTPVAGTVPGGGYTQRFVNTSTSYSAFTAVPTINLSSVAGTTVRLVFTFVSDGVSPHANPAIDNISFTYVNPQACTGTPGPGNTIASIANPVCTGTSVVLSLQNQSFDTGLSYQWESSSNGTSWNIIPAAQSSTYTTTALSTTYYRNKVTCNNSGQNTYSTAVQVQSIDCVSMQNGSITSCSAKFYDSGGSGGSYTTYEDYTYTFYPTPGNKIRVVFNAFDTESGYDFLTIHDGNSVGATQLFSGSGSTLPGTFTSSAADGSLTFHFVSDGSISYTGWDATISCLPIPACTGSPAAGTVTGTSTLCAGTSTVLTASGVSTGFSGLQYQWQESDDNGVTDNWAAVVSGSGATGTSYTSPVMVNSIYYRMLVTCSNSSQSSASPGALITVNPLPVVNLAASSTMICGTGSVNLNGFGANSYSWSPATGLNVTTGPSVIASPSASTTYTVTGTTNSCNGTASVTISVYQAVGSVSTSADTTQGCDPLTTVLHASACLNTTPTFTIDSSSTNYSPSGATGFLTMSSADDGFASINLPFSFNYFGNTYTSAYVSTNGFLSFGTSSTTLTAQLIPNSTTPNNIVALCWNDLLHSGTSTGVDTFTVGSVGSRKFVIRFNAGAVAFYNIGSQTGSFGGKIILHEGTNKIELRIDVMNMGVITGRLKTLGVENSDGTIGIAMADKNYTDWSVSGPVTYRFTPGFNCSGSAGMSYAWLPATQLTNANTANPNVTSLTANTTYTVTATSSSGCSATKTISLTVFPQPAAPTISANGPLSFCPGGNVILTSSSPSNNHWSTGETSVSINVNSSQAITLYTTAGLCASQISSSTIVRYDTIQPLITILGGGASLCGGTRDLIADGSPQYVSWNWSTNETTQGINVNSAGTYSVVTTDLNGCIEHNAFVLYPGTAPVAPIISTSSALQVCNNDLVTIQSDLTDNIVWSPTFDNSASITYNLSPPGSYDFFVTRDSLGCYSESNHLTFTVNPVPEIYSFLPADSACPGDIVTLSGSGFSGVTGISFNGVNVVAFNVMDDYTIEATIPDGASSGPVILTDNVTGCIGVGPVFNIKSSCVSTVTLQLKLYLQGYYLSGGSMNAALYNAGVSLSSLDCDTIHVCLMDANTFATVECSEVILSVDGIASCEFSPLTNNQDYFIRVTHRSALETWSSALVKMQSLTNYDFSADATNAYASNEIEVEPGVWAFWNGDVSDGNTTGLQDGFVESSDYSAIENGSQSFLFGYEVQDITGDGLVESSDYGMIENNSQLFIISAHP